MPLPPDVRGEIEAGLRARLLEPARVVPETLYLATDRETVLDRMRTRRGSHPDDYVLTAQLPPSTSTTSSLRLPTKARSR